VLNEHYAKLISFAMRPAINRARTARERARLNARTKSHTPASFREINLAPRKNCTRLDIIASASTGGIWNLSVREMDSFLRCPRAQLTLEPIKFCRRAQGKERVPNGQRFQQHTLGSSCIFQNKGGREYARSLAG
jgi:hypothetical protein